MSCDMSTGIVTIHTLKSVVVIQIVPQYNVKICFVFTEQVDPSEMVSFYWFIQCSFVLNIFFSFVLSI